MYLQSLFVVSKMIYYTGLSIYTLWWYAWQLFPCKKIKESDCNSDHWSKCSYPISSERMIGVGRIGFRLVVCGLTSNGNGSQEWNRMIASAYLAPRSCRSSRSLLRKHTRRTRHLQAVVLCVSCRITWHCQLSSVRTDPRTRIRNHYSANYLKAKSDS